MQLFYTQQITNNTAVFDEAESAHALQVLRLKPGQEVHFTNGCGMLFKGILTQLNKTTAGANNIIVVEQLAEPTHKIHLYVAPTKNADRFEWFVEKATEMGIWSITPLITERTLKRQFQTRRIKNLSLSAMKQSVQFFLPEIHEGKTLKELPFTLQESAFYIAHCIDEQKQELFDAVLPLKNTHILIGPEGDFTPNEIDFALKSGCKAVALGNTRLRTETAALYALTATKIKLQKVN